VGERAPVKIRVDRDKCIGSGNCVLTLGEVFDCDDGGIVVLITDEPAPEQEDAAREAVMLCPGRAITVDAP
jgi:ferredoxin